MGLITADHSRRWPGGCIVWDYHSDFADAQRDAIQRAITRWESRGTVRFLQRSNQRSFVRFMPDPPDDDDISHSDIGMQGGEQFLWLEPVVGGANRRRAARHELGHSLGFHHEHVRPDRDGFITVDMTRHLLRFGDYNRVGNDWEMVGDYDFRSVMHYNQRTEPDGLPNFTAVDPANEPLLADNGARNTVSDGDFEALAQLHGGNAHVYQLSGSGQIEKTVRQYDWADGWTTVTPFLMDVRNFLFLLRASDGRVHVLPVEANGTIGGTHDDRNWTSGWTSATHYTIGVDNYLFLYKRGDGTRHVNRINFDGTIGPQAVASRQLGAGWTSIRHYSVGWSNFLIFVNAAAGGTQVRRIDADGTEGDVIQTRDWSPGWTSVAPYTAGGSRYLLLLSSATGAMLTRRIGDDGRIGGTTLDRRDLAPGWSIGAPYEAGGNTFLLLYNEDTGELRIRRLRADGTFGGRTDNRRFGPGWSLARTYHVGTATYALLVKS